jgi:glyoxylase-like metal-dependent hydrolase (beta-lactamase superfamily II)
MQFLMKIKQFEFNPVCVNTYLIYDETNEAAVIDCGASTDDECKQLKTFIDSHELKLKLLLSTHLHFDHLLGNRFIYENYGLIPQYHIAEDTLPSLRIQAGALGYPVDYEPHIAEHHLSDNEVVSFGNTTLKALLTPGHSPGSLSFYCERANCVFTGDALFRYDIGRTDLWGGDEDTLITAIQTRLLTLPDNTVVYSGHGPSSTIGEEKQHNPYIL